jgi:uncharacterized sulfatase
MHLWKLLPLIGVLAVAGRPADPPAPSPARPNVLLIVSDDHAWTDYGFMGHPHLRTPHLDRLARESLCFPRGYVTASLCCPSLASIITGRFPHQHRVTSNDPPLPADVPRGQAYRTAAFREGRERMNRFLEAVPTLPRVLGTHGYRSLQTGKWWQGHYARGGFTDGMTVGDEDRGGRHGDAGLRIGRETLEPIYEFIAAARQANQPFFIWYAPLLPHDPHNPPERLLARYRDLAPSLPVARYWAMVEWFDETCGELRAHLEREGLAENTLIAYVADNGWITDPVTGRYAPKSKQSSYDGGLRTPILLHWPGRITAGQSTALASSVDLMPTLLRAGGLEPPPGLSGLDLLDAAAVAQRDAVFGACFTHDAVDLEEPGRSLRWRWCVAGDWKLILPSALNEPTGVAELYHLAADPFETRNLAAEHPDRLTSLTRRLDAWWPARLDSKP